MKFPFCILLCASLLVATCKEPAPQVVPSEPEETERPDAAGITYQLNVYSFADSDGDGWGDLKGITAHLDYLESLGVSALWLSPIHPSMSYHGYDVTDYTAVNPRLGTEADLKELIAKAGERGIDIYLDFVLNHSGSDHPWFRAAEASAESPYRAYYVFSDNPDADVAAGKIDNYAGASTPGMGDWYAIGGAGRYRFRVDFTASTVTVTATDAAPQASNPAASAWLYYGDGTLAGLYETSAGVHEIVLDYSSSWGFLIRTSTTSWTGGTKYGGNGAALTLGQPYPINNTTAADIPLSGGTSYFASFTRTMPDLNYGPAAQASASPAFQDLAAAADKWINLGVNGLRLDAVLWLYQNQTDANVAFLRQWYNRCNATYKARGGQGDLYMVGEAFTDVNAVAPYYQGLPSLFDFSYWWTLKDRIGRGKGNDFAATVEGFRKQYKSRRGDFIDAIKLSNHDEARAAEDLGKSLEKEKLAAAVLLTSPGKPYIYQGEELGYWGNQGGGDEYVRTPVKWTRSGSVPTAALGGKVDAAMLTPDISVEAQSADPNSLLEVYRRFAAARNAHPALSRGEFSPVDSADPAVAAWTLRGDGERLLVLHNFGASSVAAGNYSISSEIVSNGSVTLEGKQIVLGPYASVVYQQ